MNDHDITVEYRAELAKPIEEIREDIFFRADNFQNEPWYGDFQLYLVIGVCEPAPEHVIEVRKALKLMGYPSHAVIGEGKTYILPGEERRPVRIPQIKQHGDRER